MCTGAYTESEVQWIKIKQDEDDIEGIVIGNTVLNTQQAFMSVDISEPDVNDSREITLPGRLIGFGVTTALNTRD